MYPSILLLFVLHMHAHAPGILAWCSRVHNRQWSVYEAFLRSLLLYARALTAGEGVPLMVEVAKSEQAHRGVFFGAVPCGSCCNRVLPLINRGRAAAHISFDISAELLARLGIDIIPSEGVLLKPKQTADLTLMYRCACLSALCLPVSIVLALHLHCQHKPALMMPCDVPKILARCLSGCTMHVCPHLVTPAAMLLCQLADAAMHLLHSWQLRLHPVPVFCIVAVLHAGLSSGPGHSRSPSELLWQVCLKSSPPCQGPAQASLWFWRVTAYPLVLWCWAAGPQRGCC